MDILQNLESMLGGALSRETGAQAQPSAGAAGGGLGGLLSPDVLGSLAGALFTNKTGGAASSGAGGVGGGGGGLGGLGGLLTSLLAGGGADALGKLAQGMMGGEESAAPQAQSRIRPQTAAPASSPSDAAMRLVRTLVYAAKADGHIDDQEQAAISDQLRKSNLGPEVHGMLQKAMDESIDPARIAQGVTDAKEALQIYALSAAISNPEHFMERSYLDGLATALRIPPNVKATVEGRIRPNG